MATVTVQKQNIFVNNPNHAKSGTVPVKLTNAPDIEHTSSRPF